MNERHTHLSDEQLVDVCIQPSALGADADKACSVCDAKRAALAKLLAEVTESITADADATFAPDWLARQRERVRRRLDQAGPHGRVISFPVHANEPSFRRTHLASRWVAGAAVAGLIVGLFGGYLARNASNEPSAFNDRPEAAAALSGPLPDMLDTSDIRTGSDDEFLAEIELMLEGPGSMALRPLHDLTPAAWEVQ